MMAGVLYIVVFHVGHLGVAVALFGITGGLFKELVDVGYSEANTERALPFYRSLQWAWFMVSMSAAYSLEALNAPLNLTSFLKRLPFLNDTAILKFVPMVLDARQYHDYISFLGYSVAFIVTVLTLKEGHYKTQIHILSFTVLALSLFVVQMKMAIFNVFHGLFWFLFPLLLVAVNDTFAYFSGFTMGKKIIKGVFLTLSPNKTWEGFIGGGMFTMVAGWYLPSLLSTKWLACSYSDIADNGLDQCVVASHFIPDPGTGIAPVQYHGLVLALFASVVAPFGGFFASAIKRAYGLKDFATMIPGHGGFMDRLDCQFLMAFFTWVHLTTFVAPVTPFERAAQLVSSLSPDEQAKILAMIAP
mmetsp:Transcript_83461/g.235303  ORF Transcript_83461/g.235303 Transcript_83461/m.235303 type:complete len:359 (+) Transcript_83461:107-1183(+)